MTRGLSRIAGGAVALVLLVLVTILAMLDAPRVETPASVSSVEDDGRRAAFLLLDELGFEPVAWDERPGLLPRGRVVLWLPSVPIDPRERELETDGARPPQEALDALDLARARGLRSPRHYRGFLEQGGRIVAPLSPAMLEFLVDELGLDDLAEASLEPIEPVPQRVELTGGEALEVALTQAWGLQDLDHELPRETLATTPEGVAVVLEIPVGRGGLVLLASDDFLANERLREADHALLLVRLVEALAPPGGLHFDEHALGRGSEEGSLALALAPDTRLATLHLVLLALLAVWALAWVREFPRDPEPLAATAPLERARAISDLALRANRPAVLAGQLVEGTLRRLARRHRVPLVEGEPSAQTLTRLAAAAGLADAEPRLSRWRSELLAARVRERADLARLDAGLRALEAELGGTPHRLPRPRAAARTAPPTPTA